jgi:hypothetical protein
MNNDAWESRWMNDVDPMLWTPLMSGGDAGSTSKEQLTAREGVANLAMSVSS